MQPPIMPVMAPSAPAGPPPDPLTVLQDPSGLNAQQRAALQARLAIARILGQLGHLGVPAQQAQAIFPQAMLSPGGPQ